MHVNTTATTTGRPQGSTTAAYLVLCVVLGQHMHVAVLALDLAVQAVKLDVRLQQLGSDVHATLLALHERVAHLEVLAALLQRHELLALRAVPVGAALHVLLADHLHDTTGGYVSQARTPL